MRCILAAFIVPAFIVPAFIVGVPESSLAKTRASPALEATVTRAVALLPERPDRVVVVKRDDDDPLLRMVSPTAEGFVPRGSRTVYLIAQAPTLQQAAARGGIFDHALAIIIWHEIAHAAGAGESEARKQEEALWQRFILEGRVDRARGVAYLTLLRRRR